MEGFRCIGACAENGDLEEVDLSDTPIPWSEASSWESGEVPVEGDEVEIPSGVWIVLDIEETPLLWSLTINGRLSFQNNTEPMNQTLHSHTIYVRAGELLVGAEDQPYNGIATVKLWGNVDSEALAFSMAIEGGNKVLAVVGKLAMYGKERDQRSRLRETVHGGDSTFKVEAGLDWQAGDNVALLATAMQSAHTDYGTIKTYNNATGEVELEEPVKYYHWSQRSSTADHYNGVDMRGEVIMFTRNVRFMGNDSESWGAHIVVADNFEPVTQSFRTGQLILENVELYNSSQRNTEKSAIRLEYAQKMYHRISGCSIWGHNAWGFVAKYSKNIILNSTDVIGGR